MTIERSKTRYITMHFPLLHIDTTYPKQRDKLVEEYNEVRKELFSEAEPERMLHELQDLIQAYITLLLVQSRPTSLDERDNAERVVALLEEANQEHRKKLERYKAERGWN